MTAVIDPAVIIRFEGFTPGTEIWGGTQANYLVQLPGRNAKESAILLNDPAAKLLAADAGREDTPEFREEAARVVGREVVEDIVARNAPLESVIVASAAYFDAYPAVRARAQAALNA